MTLSVAEREPPFKEAVIVAVNEEETDVVLTVKLALVAPAGIVRLDGTVTIGALELVRLTVVEVEDTALIVTVPCEELPPVTLAGFKVKDESTAPASGGKMVKIALPLESPKYAVIVTSVGVATGLVMKSTNALFWVEKNMRSERGSEMMSGRLLVSMIVAPSVGALATSVTVARTP